MARLLIRELLTRSLEHRMLIVAPGSLVAQWQMELAEKFDLGFDIFSPAASDSGSSNPFKKQKNCSSLALTNWRVM